MSSPLIVWDSCVFLAVLKGEKDRVDVCTQILDEFRRDQIRIAISALALAEVVHVIKRERLTQGMEDRIDDLFQDKFIVVSVERHLATKARHLLWKSTKLKPKDAVVVATAIMLQADELHTYDTELLALNGQIDELKICEPSLEQMQLAGVTQEELSRKKRQ